MNTERNAGKLSRMPNQPRTTIRGIRVPDELWDDAKVIARESGYASVSEMVREDLETRRTAWRESKNG